MRPSEIAKDFYPASNQCKDCIFFPKCDEYPFDESGCKDFKDKSLFIEMPCKVGEDVWLLKDCGDFSCGIEGGCRSSYCSVDCYWYNRKYTADWKVVCHTVESTVDAAKLLINYKNAIFATREEAEAALAERMKKDA